MPHLLEDGYVYYQDEKIKKLVGSIEKEETVRIDGEMVNDVTFTFDFDLGKYVEQSRTARAEPLPPEPLTPDQRIAQLETENEQLKATVGDIELALADLFTI